MPRFCAFPRSARLGLASLAVLISSSWLMAVPPPPTMAARFLKALATGIEGSPKVAIQDASVLAEFKALGIAQENGAKVAWASSSQELKTYLGQKKLVVASSLELLTEGAAIAVVVEDARLTVYFNIENAKKIGQTIPDLVMKMGKPH